MKGKKEKKNIMIKGVYYEKEKKREDIVGVIYDDINIDSQPNEHWLPVFDSVIPDIKPYYYISDMGRLYSTKANNGKGGFRSLNPSSTDGYVHAELMKKDGLSKNIGIHRLEMLTFEPIENSIELLVNHKDGDKTNNCKTNLEWSTPQENARHAYDTNLSKPRYGESNHNTKHSKELVLKICEGLEKKLDIFECAKYVGIEPTRENRKYISKIKSGEIWGHLSCNFDIPQEPYSIPRRFDDDTAHTICCYFEQELKPSKVADIMFPELQGLERDTLIRSLYKIHRGDSYKDISQYYDWPGKIN